MPLRLHAVLLALAGRVDDSALGHARQLAASARIDEAAELIAGTLIAGGIPLRPSEQHELGGIFATSGADVALLDQLVVTEHDVEPKHDFGSNDQPDRGITEAIEPIKAALTDVRSIHAVWRNTASGRVPGQVPQRVVLVEVGAQGSPLATAHLVAAALRNAGIRAVVEVASADIAWPNYHQHALAAAVAVDAVSSAAAPVDETDGRVAPSSANGHRLAPEQPSESDWPQPQPELVAEQPTESPRAEHTAPPNDHAVESPRNDHPVEPLRSRRAAEAPSADHGVEPQHPENTFAPPRAGYPGEPQRNGHHAEPPRVDRHAEPRQHEVVEPPRADHVAAPQSNGTAPEPPRGHAAEAFPNAQHAEPRNGHPEVPRNGHHAEPPRDSHPAEPPRADRPAEPPRYEYPAEPPRADHGAAPPNHGGSNVVHFPESAAESTAEMSRNDAQRLHQALREAEAADRSAPQAPQREAVEVPAAEAEAQLSDRDRELLRELHAELAKREREQAAQVQLNGWHRPGA